MKIARNTLAELVKIVTGDSQMSPYRSGPVLVRLFNEYGAKDVYEQGFPSRWKYTEEKLLPLNETSSLRKLINQIFDAREWIDNNLDPKVAAVHLNKFLKFDGYELVHDGDHFKVRETGGVVVQFDTPFPESQEVNHVFIEEQVLKCDKKIEEGDFDGAITNARSLVEAVLIEIEKQLSPAPQQYDGDLVKLNKRVQMLLNLDPSRKDISDILRQVLSGLTSVVNGLAGMRNKMSDAHVAGYKALKHHAKLAVNSAKTFADFIFDSYSYQKGTGKIK
ncbi:MAG: abortive infection family protein [Verrucomicrobia bacterium]|nr:abortive infection family protein [Verrucomicrobiota bacterium]